MKSITAKIDPMLDISDCPKPENFEIAIEKVGKIKEKAKIDDENIENVENIEENAYKPNLANLDGNPFEPFTDNKLKVLYREAITTSLLYKAMAKIYKKICYREK